MGGWGEPRWILISLNLHITNISILLDTNLVQTIYCMEHI